MPVVLTADRKTADPRITRETADTAVVVLALENPYRRSYYIFNEPGGAIMYVKFGAAASTTDYSVQIAAGAFYEMPKDPRSGLADHSGVITAVWASASGAAQTTEFPAQDGV